VAAERERGVEELAQLLERARTVGAPEDLDALTGQLRSSQDATGDDELAELAALADVLRAVPGPRPRPAFVTDLRSRLVAEASAAPTAPAQPEPSAVPFIERLRRSLEVMRRSAAVATASAVGAMMIGGVGVVAAAERSAPDSALYGLKQVTESVRLAAAQDEASGARLHLEFAERRLSEVVEGVGRLPGDQLIETLERMDQHTTTGATRLLDEHLRTGETEPLRDVAGFVERQRRGLRDVVNDLPVDAAPFALASLELLDQIGDQVALTAMHGCVPCVEGAVDSVERCCPDEPVPERAGAPGGVPDDLEAERLARTLERRAGDVDAPQDGVAESTSGSGTSESEELGEQLADPVGETARDVTERTTDQLGELTDGSAGTETTRRTTEDLTDTTRRTTDEAAETTRRTSDRVAETADELTGLLD
jgi:hypothetical protein